MIVDLDEWRTRMTLEALQALEEKWTAIIADASAKGDEDTCADFGNDLMMLRTLREDFEAKSVEAYGPTIINFSREPHASAAKPT